MNIKNKRLIALLSVFGILVLTNPTNKDFESYLDAASKGGKSGKLHNYFIFSVYNTTYHYSYSSTTYTYLGIFKNFYFLKDEKRK